MRFWGAFFKWSVLLFAADKNSNNNANVKVEQLQMRLQMGYEAADEARSLLEDKQYQQASSAFMDALNLGRKPALALQEFNIEAKDEENNNNNLQEEALQWLINVCCESAQLNLNHLDNLDNARKDAWAACVFSQYQNLEPLQCMQQVCQQGKDLMGEFQACQQLLNLSFEEFDSKDPKRETLSNRIEELEQMLRS